MHGFKPNLLTVSKASLKYYHYYKIQGGENEDCTNY